MTIELESVTPLDLTKNMIMQRSKRFIEFISDNSGGDVADMDR